MEKYQSKQITIDAIQFNENNINEVLVFLGEGKVSLNEPSNIRQFRIKKTDSEIIVVLNDYIVIDNEGKFHVIKHNLFEMIFTSLNK